MISLLIKKIFGSSNDREVRRLRQVVTKINEFGKQLENVPDDALRAKTAEWKAKLAHIEDGDRGAVDFEDDVGLLGQGTVGRGGGSAGGAGCRRSCGCGGRA
jgi:hypothetical protein